MKVVVYVHVGNAATSQQVRHLIHRCLLSNKDIQVGFFVWLKGCTGIQPAGMYRMSRC